jgi:hypothetical protein
VDAVADDREVAAGEPDPVDGTASECASAAERIGHGLPVGFGGRHGRERAAVVVGLVAGGGCGQLVRDGHRGKGYADAFKEGASVHG